MTEPNNYAIIFDSIDWRETRNESYALPLVFVVNICLGFGTTSAVTDKRWQSLVVDGDVVFPPHLDYSRHTWNIPATLLGYSRHTGNIIATLLGYSRLTWNIPATLLEYSCHTWNISDTMLDYSRDTVGMFPRYCWNIPVTLLEYSHHTVGIFPPHCWNISATLLEYSRHTVGIYPPHCWNIPITLLEYSRHTVGIRLRQRARRCNYFSSVSSNYFCPRGSLSVREMWKSLTMPSLIN